MDLHTEDALDLTAWYAPATGPARGTTVLVLPGNAGSRVDRVPLARALCREGFAVLLLDYRGYGGNSGVADRGGLGRRCPGRARVPGRRAGRHPARLVVFGESLGSAVAARLARERPVGGLVLRSPFTSLADVAAVHYPLLPVRLLLRDRFPVREHVAALTAPVVVVGGRRGRDRASGAEPRRGRGGQGGVPRGAERAAQRPRAELRTNGGRRCRAGQRPDPCTAGADGEPQPGRRDRARRRAAAPRGGAPAGRSPRSGRCRRTRPGRPCSPPSRRSPSSHPVSGHVQTDERRSARPTPRRPRADEHPAATARRGSRRPRGTRGSRSGRASPRRRGGGRARAQDGARRARRHPASARSVAPGPPRRGPGHPAGAIAPATKAGSLRSAAHGAANTTPNARAPGHSACSGGHVHAAGRRPEPVHGVVEEQVGVRRRRQLVRVPGPVELLRRVRGRA